MRSLFLILVLIPLFSAVSNAQTPRPGPDGSVIVTPQQISWMFSKGIDLREYDWSNKEANYYIHQSLRYRNQRDVFLWGGIALCGTAFLSYAVSEPTTGLVSARYIADIVGTVGIIVAIIKGGQMKRSLNNTVMYLYK